MLMNTPASSHEEDLLHFPLAGLLPPDSHLIVNPLLRTATVFTHGPDNETRMIAQQHFSPYEMRILMPLLHAYPSYCSYELLLAHLFSISLEEARRHLSETRTLTIRPIRRAIGGLVVGLATLGLHVRNIRGAGYLVEAA